MVLAIAALVLTVVPPLMSAALPGVELKAAARRTLSSLRLARETAIRSGGDSILIVDVEGHRLELPGYRTISLPQRVDLQLEAASGEMLDEQRGAIRFFPDGSSTGGRIILARARDAINGATRWGSPGSPDGCAWPPGNPSEGRRSWPPPPARFLPHRGPGRLCDPRPFPGRPDADLLTGESDDGRLRPVQSRGQFGGRPTGGGRRGHPFGAWHRDRGAGGRDGLGARHGPAGGGRPGPGRPGHSRWTMGSVSPRPPCPIGSWSAYCGGMGIGSGA